MTITFSREAHIHLVAFVSPPGAGFDALFVVHVPPGSDKVRLDYRFRYDGQAGDDDRRNWYAFEAKSADESPKKMIETVKLLASTAIPMFDMGAEWVDIFELDCDGQTAAETLLEKAPWFNPSPTQPDRGAQA